MAYIRVLAVMGREELISLDLQCHAIHAFAAREGITIVDEIARTSTGQVGRSPGGGSARRSRLSGLAGTGSRSCGGGRGGVATWVSR